MSQYLRKNCIIFLYSFFRDLPSCRYVHPVCTDRNDITVTSSKVEKVLGQLHGVHVRGNERSTSQDCFSLIFERPGRFPARSLIWSSCLQATSAWQCYWKPRTRTYILLRQTYCLLGIVVLYLLLDSIIMLEQTSQAGSCRRPRPRHSCLNLLQRADEVGPFLLLDPDWSMSDLNQGD